MIALISLDENHKIDGYILAADKTDLLYQLDEADHERLAEAIRGQSYIAAAAVEIEPGVWLLADRTKWV